jgi:aspartate racemase
MALQRAGAEFLVICTNTMHKFANEVERESGLPLLHIADVVGRAIKDYEMLRVGLLGTRFTMEDPFYRGRLEDRFGLEVLTPEAEDRTIINHVIYIVIQEGANMVRIGTKIFGEREYT